MKLVGLLLAATLLSCANNHSTESITNNDSQNDINLPDSLRKYSYFVFGFKNMGNGLMIPGSGSGYFIRKSGKLFFLTARHVFCPCDYPNICEPTVKRRNYPDTLQIVLTNLEGENTSNSIILNIKEFRNSCDCEWPPRNPDLIAYEVSVPPDTVYSVESLITNLPKSKGHISIFGYPSSKVFETGTFSVEKSTHLLIKDFNLFENYRYINCQNDSATAEQDYIVSVNEEIYNPLNGFSGSPAFVFDYENKNWALIGTFVAVVEDDEKLRIIKPVYIDSVIRNPIQYFAR